jgi:uncharacterized protein
MSGQRRSLLLVFMLLAFAITWAVWLPRAAASQEWFDSDLIVALGSVWTYGPAVAAVLAAAWTGGRASLRELGSRLVRSRVGWGGYAAILAITAALSVASFGFASLAGADHTVARPEGGLLGLALLLVLLSLTDGLGEEVGWRGWALPRLLEHRRALEASLVLGVVWAAWHLPLHWTDGSYLADVPVWALFVRLPATAIIFTWVFRHTRGSALVAVLFHGALSVGALYLPPGAAGAIGGAVAHWAAALALLAVAGPDLSRWPGHRHAPAVQPTSLEGGRGDPTPV